MVSHLVTKKMHLHILANVNADCLRLAALPHKPPNFPSPQSDSLAVISAPGPSEASSNNCHILTVIGQ